MYQVPTEKVFIFYDGWTLHLNDTIPYTVGRPLLAIEKKEKDCQSDIKWMINFFHIILHFYCPALLWTNINYIIHNNCSLF